MKTFLMSTEEFTQWLEVEWENSKFSVTM